MKKRGKIFSKRGLSEVIVSIIMVLLVLVAIGIVWVVVKNVISSGTENINLGVITTNLEIKKVIVNEANVSVKVKRNPGEGTISGLKFIIDDGINTQTFDKEITLQELEEKTIVLEYSGLVKDVSVAPIFKTESGKEKPGNVLDNHEFTREEIIKNLQPTSWYRFEGNVNDEMGNNNGVISGGVNCNAEGKIGKACEFNGVDGYIDTTKSISAFFSADKGTIMVWVKPKEKIVASDGDMFSLPYLVGDKNGYFGIYIGDYLSGDKIWFYNSGRYETPFGFDYNGDEWTNVVWNQGNEKVSNYKNGKLVEKIQNIDTTGLFENFYIGGPNPYNSKYFNGTIDEIIIFNKSLSDEEIKALYELDVSDEE